MIITCRIFLNRSSIFVSFNWTRNLVSNPLSFLRSCSKPVPHVYSSICMCNFFFFFEKAHEHKSWNLRLHANSLFKAFDDNLLCVGNFAALRYVIPCLARSYFPFPPVCSDKTSSQVGEFPRGWVSSYALIRCELNSSFSRNIHFFLIFLFYSTALSF